MPTLGTVAMSKNRDSDTAAARTGNTTADKPSRHAAASTRPNDPLRWPHQRIQICGLTSHDTISGTHRVGIVCWRCLRVRCMGLI